MSSGHRAWDAGMEACFLPLDSHWPMCNRMVALSLHSCGHVITSLTLSEEGKDSMHGSYYCSFSESTFLTSPDGLEKSHYPMNRPSSLKWEQVTLTTDICFIAFASLNFSLKSHLYSEVCPDFHLMLPPARPQNSFHPSQLFLLSIALTIF